MAANAKVLARTADNDVLVKMRPADVRKISGNPNLSVGDSFNISPIYNKLTWLVDKQTELTTLVAQLRTFATNLEDAVDAAIGGS